MMDAPPLSLVLHNVDTASAHITSVAASLHNVDTASAHITSVAASLQPHLLLRLSFLLLVVFGLLAPEALRLPRLYSGDLRVASLAHHRPLAAPGGSIPTRFHPVREDCAPSWEVPVVSAPLCHTALQCVLMRAGMNFSHGFFIEAGAFDGVSGSITLMFERHLCWTGLLVEPSDRFYGKLPVRFNGAEAVGGAEARPHAHFVHGALVDSAHDGNELIAGIDDEPTNSVPADSVGQGEIAAILGGKTRPKVKGYSVASLLRKLGVGRRGVDFWSLDVESYELQALNGLEDFRPTLLLIEVWTQAPTLDNAARVRAKLKELGYVNESVSRYDPNEGAVNHQSQDVIFRYAGV
jgi:hypothetical protein